MNANVLRKLYQTVTASTFEPLHAIHFTFMQARNILAFTAVEPHPTLLPSGGWRTEMTTEAGVRGAVLATQAGLDLYTPTQKNKHVSDCRTR